MSRRFIIHAIIVVTICLIPLQAALAGFGAAPEWLASAAIQPNFALAFTESCYKVYELQILSPWVNQTNSVSPDNYTCGKSAITSNASHFFYAWSKGTTGGPFDIEYTILDHSGNVSREITRLTYNAEISSEIVQASDPSIEAAYNGNVGVLWEHRRYSSDFQSRNNNIYFALLNPQGELIAGPLDLTHNTVWESQSLMSGPNFYELRLISLTDNRFVAAWTRSAAFYALDSYDVYYSIIDASGNQAVQPVKASSDAALNDFIPVLTRLANNRFLVGYPNLSSVEYKILDSQGKTIQDTQAISLPAYTNPNGVNAVTSPNGQVLVLWGTWVYEEQAHKVGYVFLSSDTYAPLEEVRYLENHAFMEEMYPAAISADLNGNFNLVWDAGSPNSYIYYEMLDGQGQAIIAPAILQAANEDATFTWMHSDSISAIGLVPILPILRVSTPEGAPGSIFTLRGSNLPVLATLDVRVNNQVVGTVTTDANGAVRFQLDTSGASDGRFVVTLGESSLASAAYGLDALLAVQVADGTAPVIFLANGSGLDQRIYLPVLTR